MTRFPVAQPSCDLVPVISSGDVDVVPFDFLFLTRFFCVPFLLGPLTFRSFLLALSLDVVLLLLLGLSFDSDLLTFSFESILEAASLLMPSFEPRMPTFSTDVDLLAISFDFDSAPGQL